MRTHYETTSGDYLNGYLYNIKFRDRSFLALLSGGSIIRGSIKRSSVYYILIISYFPLHCVIISFPQLLANGQGIDCCTTSGQFSTQNANRVECLPIEVPTSDDFFRGSRRCMNFVRSMGAPSLDCNLGPTEQVFQWCESL